MPSSKSVEHLKAAIAAFEQGDLVTARQRTEAAIKRDNGNAHAFSVLAILLVREGKPELATEAFRKALFMSPGDPRNAYNLAAHTFALGDYWQARTIVVESLKDDPNFALSKALLERIDAGNPEGTVEFSLPDISRIEVEQVQSEGHALPFMFGMDRPWTAAGWIFVGIAVIAGASNLVFQPLLMTAAKTGAQNPPLNIKSDAASMVTILLMSLSGLLSFLWMLIDVVDKRMRIVWMVPSVVCCACGMHAVPHALYMFMRRQ
ncbi:MAG TPA: tetratricopeptide repeat protein [Fimbriimonas sp.]|nr:tetratricopeptide repeat protein [Fimbriimonas sp.]